MLRDYGVMRVVEAPAEATWDLRRRVLGNRTPGPADARLDAFHLTVVDDDGAVAAVATFFPDPSDHRPGRRAVRLRGMAVEPERQGRGIGALLLAAAIDRLRAEGVEVLWAHGRETAIGFYERLGWEVIGDVFVNEDGICHHVVLFEL